MDDTRSSRRERSLLDGPCADLDLSDGEVLDEVERRVARGDDLGDHALRLLLGEESLASSFVVAERAHGRLERCGERDDLAVGIARLHPLVDLRTSTNKIESSG